MDRLGGVCRQLRKQVCEVLGHVDLGPVTVGNEGVKHGGTLAADWISHKEPVLFADGTGANGIFHQVIVYASTSRWGSPGENPGWRRRSSQKHWERFRR